MLLATICGITLGVLSARNPGGWLDRFALGARVPRDLFPVYWVGLLLILLFAVTLRWLPPSGYGGVALPGAAGARARDALDRVPRAHDPLGDARGARRATSCARRARRGCAERVVVVRHALRNALIPVITVLGLDFG